MSGSGPLNFEIAKIESEMPPENYLMAMIDLLPINKIIRPNNGQFVVPSSKIGKTKIEYLGNEPEIVGSIFSGQTIMKLKPKTVMVVTFYSCQPFKKIYTGKTWVVWQ